MNILEVKNLKVNYGQVVAVKKVDLHVAKGEQISIAVISIVNGTIRMVFRILWDIKRSVYILYFFKF